MAEHIRHNFRMVDHPFRYLAAISVIPILAPTEKNPGAMPVYGHSIWRPNDRGCSCMYKSTIANHLVVEARPSHFMDLC